MAIIEMLKFPDLEIIGTNYIAWAIDMELYLEAQELLDTIKMNNVSPPKDKARAIIFLRKHLDENVLHDYAHLKDPAELWQALKERFNNLKEIIIPHALDEWKNLRFHDFDKVEKYYSTMLRIVSQLKFCGKTITEAEMLEKTYHTFNKENQFLQEMYRHCRYEKVSELIVNLILIEKSNELLLRNYNSQPTGTSAFPEGNTTNATDIEIRNEETQPIGVVVVDSIGQMEDPTTQKTESLTNEFDLNKVPRDKNPRGEIPKRKREGNESQ